ncbi:MAG: transcriptional repressor LexA [Candidatus Taylorbacteria bacterium]|nr:transcriptional repressor LexA [Candidatus Taylorbacteria bacterium]
MQTKSTINIGNPSKRQAEILHFAREYRRENGYSPALVEIAKHFDISIPTVHEHVSHLREKNLLTAERGKKRSIQSLRDHKSPIVEIPLMGFISAGGPIEAIRNPEPIEVPRSMLSSGENYYALKVTGRSMIEEGISDGDIVIIHEQSTVNSGEKAVAYMPDRNEVTLKKIYMEKNRIKLVPANKYMSPFYETNVEIQGKVVGVLRKEN